MIILLILSISITTVLSSYKILLIYQLGGYRLGEFFRALKRKKCKAILPLAFFLLLTSLALITPVFLILPPVFALVTFLVMRKNSKVKLRYTKRFTRFFALYILLSPLVITLLFSHALTYPLEEWRNKRFVERKTESLRKDNRLIKIAVTGSYGKTTVKTVLAQFLGVKYKVATTKENYNTPMGIALSSDFPADTEVFIAEMGARRKGDIKRLVEIVAPNFGVITKIGSQHLETFKSEANIKKEKLTLANYLSVKNLPVVTLDYEPLLNLPSVEKECKIEDITTGERGTSFLLTVGGESARIETPLIGKHIPQTLSLCILCALELEIPLEEIKNVAKTLKPVAHRLELLYNGKDAIIDDAYNANESSVINAISLLPEFKGRIKVLVTPGVVEAGKRQREINYEIGVTASEKVDYAIFIGANSVALSEGARGGKAQVICLKTLGEAVEKLEKIEGERVILFSNDLPDNY